MNKWRWIAWCAFGLLGVRAHGKSPVVIHPVGDSITHGMDQAGYRRGLARRLNDAHVDHRFVGTLFAAPDGAHDGHDGWTIDRVGNAVGEWLARFKPDVVLLMIGANDIETGADLPTSIARYRRALDQIHAARPRARVLVSEVTTIRDPAFDRAAVAFNEELSALVEADRKRGRPLTFVRMHDVLKPGDLRDLDHPTTAGNDKLAERWWLYLKPLVGG